MNRLYILSLLVLSTIVPTGLFGQGLFGIDSVPTILSGQLDNGFQYLVLHNDKPRREINLQLLLDAGRRQEPKGKTGLSHLVTHLLFSSLPEKNIQKMQMSSINFWSDEYAKVNHEETVFKFTIRQADQSNLAEYFQLINQLVGSFEIAPESFNANKDLFINELPRLLKDIAIAEFFDALSNGRDDRITSDYISYLDRVEKLQLIDAKSYFKDYYTPERMTLVVTGDLSNIDNVETLISDHFKSFLSNPSHARPHGVIPIWEFLNDSIHIVRMSGEHISLSGFDLVFKQSNSRQSNRFSYKDFLIQQMVLRCVKGRLKPLNLDRKNQILHTGIHYNQIIGNQPFLTLSTVSRENKTAFQEVTKVLHELLNGGVESNELLGILNEMESDIQKMTTEQLSPSTEQLSRNLLLSLTSPVPFYFPTQALAEFKALAPKVDKDFMDQMIRQTLKLSGLKIFVFEEQSLSHDQLSDKEIMRFLHFN